MAFRRLFRFDLTLTARDNTGATSQSVGDSSMSARTSILNDWPWWFFETS